MGVAWEATTDWVPFGLKGGWVGGSCEDRRIPDGVAPRIRSRLPQTSRIVQGQRRCGSGRFGGGDTDGPQWLGLVHPRRIAVVYLDDERQFPRPGRIPAGPLSDGLEPRWDTDTHGPASRVAFS
jgi:hypothetical protein